MFIVKSAWEIVRKKDEVSNFFKNIWVKGLPFKIYFFGWRVWTNKIPVAAVMARWNPNTSQFCSCCVVPVRETIEHLFLKGEMAISVWDYFSNAAGIIGPRIQVKQTMTK